MCSFSSPPPPPPPGPPGLQVQFRVDEGFLRPGEKRWFLRYLALHTMHIDIWDSNSLLLIGSTAIELKVKALWSMHVTHDSAAMDGEHFSLIISQHKLSFQLVTRDDRNSQTLSVYACIVRS